MKKTLSLVLISLIGSSALMAELAAGPFKYSTSIPTTGWTDVNPGSAFFGVNYPGAFKSIVRTHGQIDFPAYSYRAHGKQPTDTYTVTAGFIPEHGVKNGNDLSECGLFFRDSSSARYVGVRAGWGNDLTAGRGYIATTKYDEATNGLGTVSMHYAGDYTMTQFSDEKKVKALENRMVGTPIQYFKIIHDANIGKLVMYYSRGGYIWTEVDRRDITDYMSLDPNEIGFLAGRQNTGASGCTLHTLEVN